MCVSTWMSSCSGRHTQPWLHLVGTRLCLSLVMGSQSGNPHSRFGKVPRCLSWTMFPSEKCSIPRGGEAGCDAAPAAQTSGRDRAGRTGLECGRWSQLDGGPTVGGNWPSLALGGQQTGVKGGLGCTGHALGTTAWFPAPRMLPPLPELPSWPWAWDQDWRQKARGGLCVGQCRPLSAITTCPEPPQPGPRAHLAYTTAWRPHTEPPSTEPPSPQLREGVARATPISQNPCPEPPQPPPMGSA